MNHSILPKTPGATLFKAVPVALLAPFLALSLTACGEKALAGSTENPEAEQTATTLERVRVEPVVIDTIERSLEAVANVQSLDEVDVLPERAEPVLQILAEEGQVVEKGQVLATLRDRVAQLAFQEAEVQVTEASNEVNRAKRDFERNGQLADRPDGTSLLSDRELETSEQALLAARTGLESAKVRLDQAKLDLDRCTLRAPIDGTVTARDVSVGDQTIIGQRAFQITDLQHPRVIFYRPQSEFGLLEPGQLLIATSEAFPGLEISGTVERISPVVDAESGTVKVTAILEPLSGQPLPTGLLVRLRLVLESRPNSTLVPKRALVHRGEETFVFKIVDGVAVKVLVAAGFENPSYLQALESELTAEDSLVTVGLDRLEDGDSVEVLDN